MDIATIGGILAGTAVVLAAVLVGGDIRTFSDVPSALIVIGGGFSATFIRFPLSVVFSALLLGIKTAFTHKKTNPRDTIVEITNLADTVRKNGPLGLEGIDISDPFLSKGVQYIADGYDGPFILESLERERDLNLERLEDGQRVFKAIGDAAPAFGMIGTLVGLVQMLANMDDPSSIGPAMAIALLTTLYGALLANLIALPIADKLGLKMKFMEINSTLAIDGIMQIRENKSPNLIRELLIAYLPEKMRADLAEAA